MQFFTLLKDGHWMWVGYLALVIVFYSVLYKDLWKNDRDRPENVAGLREDGLRARYVGLLTPILDWLDVKLANRPEGFDPETDTLPPSDPLAWNTAWSGRLLQITTLLAVTYPVLTALAQWLCGYAIRFGGAEIVPAGNGIARIFTVFWLGSSLFLFIYVTFSKSALRMPLFVLAALILVGGLFLPNLVDALDVPLAVAGTLGFAVVVAGAGAGAFVFAVAGAGAFAVAFVFAVAVAGAIAIADAFVFAAAVGGAFAAAGAFAVAVDWLTGRSKRPGWIFAGYLLLIGVALWIAMRLFPPATEPLRFAQQAFIVLMFGFFPLLNAFADFLSTGLTRFLLRRGLGRHPAGQACLDVIGGGVLFLALGCAAITVVHLARFSDGTPLMDLPGLFTALGTDARGEYVWLAILLGTTLIPTLIHGVIGMMALLITYPKALRHWIADMLEQGETSDTRGSTGTLAYSAVSAASIWVVVVAAYLLFTANHGWLITQIIGVFHWYARLIGTV